MKILEPAKVFYCYAREDEKMRDRLAQHLDPLKRANKIMTWYDREISPGTEFKQEIIAHIDSADIILALISPDFVSSNYCQDIEIHRALQRHFIGSTRIVPIILKDVEWQLTTLGHLQALPTNAKPLTLWSPIDKGFRDVALGIEKVVNEVSNNISLINKEECRRYDQLGFTLYQSGFFEEAIPFFKKALQYDSDNIHAWMSLIDCLISLGQDKEALLACDYPTSQYPLIRDTFFAMEDELDTRLAIEDYEYTYRKKYELLKSRGPSPELEEFKKDYQYILNDMNIFFSYNYKL